MGPFLNLIQIIMAIALIVLILLQTKSGGLGSPFGGDDSGMHTTRRGVDKIIFNVTIGVSVAFFIVALLNVIVAG